MPSNSKGRKTSGKIKDLKSKRVAAREADNVIGGSGDDDALAGAALQELLQKQQQTLQMMSNIGKQLQDTAQAVIRKIGG